MSQTQHENSAISKINLHIGRKKDPARKDIASVLEWGAHTLKQFAEESNHSTRTASLHLKELVKSGDVKRLDLRSGGYPRNASKVFYQIDLLAGPEVRSPFDFYVHERGRLRTIPMFRKGMTPLGRRLLDERAWLSRTNPHYVIIRPWLKARQKR